MPKRGHSEEEIVRVLRQVEAGEKVADIWSVWENSYSLILGGPVSVLCHQRGCGRD
jgi:hypothetical protein